MKLIAVVAALSLAFAPVALAQEAEAPVRLPESATLPTGEMEVGGVANEALSGGAALLRPEIIIPLGVVIVGAGVGIGIAASGSGSSTVNTTTQ